MIPAGEAAKGYIAITTQASGTAVSGVQEIVKTVYGAGKGNLEDKNAHRQRLSQPRHRERHPECRGDPHRAGEVRPPHADRR